MTPSNAFDPSNEPELFSALLTPHRSLSRAGFLALMLFVIAVSFAAGLVCVLIGAWLVFGFFVLDVLAFYWAFRINFRSGRASEEIRVTTSELQLGCRHPDFLAGPAAAEIDPESPVKRQHVEDEEPEH